jgi:hypothetical protein
MPGMDTALSPSGAVSSSRSCGSPGALIPRRCFYPTHSNISSQSEHRSTRHRQCSMLVTATAAGGAAATGRQPSREGLVAAGPATPAPEYSTIDAQPLNRVVYGLFRRRMVQAIGSDSQLDGCGSAALLNPLRPRPARSQPPQCRCICRVHLFLV